MPVLERHAAPVNRKGYSKYRFHDLQPGQTMFEKFHGQTSSLATLQATIKASARYQGVPIETQIDEKKNGIRYWRRGDDRQI